MGAADVVVVEGDGAITIVECELAANAEIRHWVIGQAFSYAAGLWQLSYDDLERQAQGANVGDAVKARENLERAVEPARDAGRSETLGDGNGARDLLAGTEG